MKIRQGFVSNSSSASFVIDKEHLAEGQMDAIRNHINFARDNHIDCSYGDYRDEWTIVEDEEKIGGSTSMDNFEMHKFLKAIGVNMSFVDLDSEKYVWEMEKNVRVKALDMIRIKTPIKTVTLPFEYHEKPYLTLKLSEKDYRCNCPECDETIFYDQDIFRLEPIENAVEGEEVVRCSKCKSYFMLLGKTGEVHEWKWGHIPYEDVVDIDKIIQKVGM